MDWNEKIKEALDRTEFLAIATVDGAESWTNPVAFAYDARANLYFISMMDAKHVQNIVSNGHVSAAIFKTECFSDGDVLGLQLAGTCEHLTERESIKEAAQHYFSRSTSNDEFREKTSAVGGLDAVWQFFKITPTELWCFDSRIFGEKRERVELKTVNLPV